MTLFANAKVIPAKKTAARKAEVETISLKGLERYAALDAAMKTLKGLKDAEEANLKAAMGARFVATGVEQGKRPDNFKAVEKSAEASCQLKVRATTSPLSDDECEMLKQNNIPYETLVTQAEAFMINPEYTNDMALLAKVEQALSVVDLPSNFLLKVEEVSKPVANEASLNAIFGKPNLTAAALMPMVSTMAIKSKIEADVVWAILDQIMNPVIDNATAK